MTNNLYEALENVNEETWEGLFQNLYEENMEAILWEDGEINFRYEGHRSELEENIIAYLPLKSDELQEMLIEFNIYDYENDSVLPDIDRTVKNDFIEEVLKNLFIEK